RMSFHSANLNIIQKRNSIQLKFPRGTSMQECDVLVIGSGAGGLSTAVTAATLGLNVIVLEKEAVLGGTTAWSGGWMWIPRNPLAVGAGINEDVETPRQYLLDELGDGFDPARIDAYLR